MEELRKEGVTGTVTKYEEERGYGFVSTLDVKDASTTDVFFHISDVDASSVEVGWRFQFDVFSSRKGFRAGNINVLSEGSEEEASEEVDERFWRARNSEYDDSKSGVRPERKKRKEGDGKAEPRSPFNDSVVGSKNDLL